MKSVIDVLEDKDEKSPRKQNHIKERKKIKGGKK